jgi:hypothetical protein
MVTDRKTILIVLLYLLPLVLSGCPADMLKYYISGTVADRDGNGLNDIMITVDICNDGEIEAKEVTYKRGTFTIIESSWEDCENALLVFEDINRDSGTGKFKTHQQVIKQKRIDTDKYDYYTEKVRITLTRE